MYMNRGKGSAIVLPKLLGLCKAIKFSRFCQAVCATLNKSTQQLNTLNVVQLSDTNLTQIVSAISEL